MRCLVGVDAYDKGQRVAQKAARKWLFAMSVMVYEVMAYQTREGFWRARIHGIPGRVFIQLRPCSAPGYIDVATAMRMAGVLIEVSRAPGFVLPDGVDYSLEPFGVTN